MKINLPVAALLFLFAGASVGRAGMVIEVQILEGKPTTQPAATQPVRGTPAIPADGKIMASIETLAESSRNFHACAALDDHELELTGNLHPDTTAHYYRVELNFLDRSASGIQQIKTSIVAVLGEPIAIGALLGRTDKPLVITLRLADSSPRATTAPRGN